jgi:hypothetical protein
MSPWYLRFYKLLLLSIGFLVIEGCVLLLSSGIRNVPVDEADQYGIGLDAIRSLDQGDKPEHVIAVLGEPADRKSSCVLNGIIWRYPIRAWNDIANTREIVPAIRLRVRFDELGLMNDWGFVDSITGRSLEIQETINDAYKWFKSLSKAPPPIPPCIDLNKTLIRGQTTQEEVEQVLGKWHPDLYCSNGGEVPIVEKRIMEHGSLWDWYVDRPSPLFVPPRYLVVSYDKDMSLIGLHFESTYPGGKK